MSTTSHVAHCATKILPQGLPVTKTVLAFQWSMEKLFNANQHLYFWTFTWTKKYPDCFYGRAWTMFWTQVFKYYGKDCVGLRVFEPHVTGGLHCHMVCNKRIWVGLVRRVGFPLGVGIIHVRKCRKTEGLYYNPKTKRKQWCPSDLDYLSKYLGPCDFGAKGVRKWARVGKWVGTRCKDIEVSSPSVDLLRLLVRQDALEGVYYGPRCTFAKICAARALRDYLVRENIAEDYVLDLTNRDDYVPLLHAPIIDDPF